MCMRSRSLGSASLKLGRTAVPTFDRSLSNSARSLVRNPRNSRGACLAGFSTSKIVSSFPIYLFIFIVFLNRYVFGWYLALIRRKHIDPKIAGYEPTVTIVVPLFNEGPSIYDTIKSFAALEYP